MVSISDYILPANSVNVHQIEGKRVCRFSLLSGRNVSWPRRMLPLVSHGGYADGTDRQRDGRTHDRYITLSDVDAASVIILPTLAG